MIKVGKWADLLVVDGDPVADIAVMRRIQSVVKNGEVVMRDGALV